MWGGGGGEGALFLNYLKKKYIITIYDTVISSEAGDKVFEPGIFYFERFRGFFDGLFDTSV